MENSDLINKYIEKLNAEVAETNKKRIVVEAQYELATDKIAAKDDEWNAKLREIINEMNDNFERKLEERQKENDKELKAIVAQRAELQDQCNSLRLEKINLSDELFTLKNTNSRKKIKV